MKRFVALLLLTSCSSVPTPPPEPVVVTKEVKVAVPVPCAALEKIGAEPDYPDTDKALAAAPNLFERVKLLLQGRLMRVERLAQYNVAKVTCQ